MISDSYPLSIKTGGMHLAKESKLLRTSHLGFRSSIYQIAVAT